jgi:hypothetical protein
MSSYQKFTLSTIKENLKAGKYKDATGANRAIGKTQELSAADKEKAKALVAKHFGVDVKAAKKPAKLAKPVAKAAKPVKVEAAPKKASKKASKKAPKKAAAKPAPAEKPAKLGRPPKAKGAAAAKPAKEAKASKGTKGKGKKTTAKRSPRAKPQQDIEVAPAAQAALPLTTSVTRKPNGKQNSLRPVMEDISCWGKIIESIALAIKTMESAKLSFPKVSFDEGVSTAQSAMAKAVARLEHDVLGGSTPAASTSKSTAAAKTTAKKVKKTKGPAPVLVGKPVEDSEDEGYLVNNVRIDQDLVEREELTDDDRLNMQLAREHAPKSSGSNNQSAEV